MSSKHDELSSKNWHMSSERAKSREQNWRFSMRNGDNMEKTAGIQL